MANDQQGFVTSVTPKRDGVAATEVQRISSVPAEAEALARLVVIEGPNRGAAMALVRAQATVGRHPTNDLVLSDPRVSSVHLEVTRRPAGHVLVRDAGSSNGSWIGAQRLIEVELAPDATVRVGDTVLRVELEMRAVSGGSTESTRLEGLI